MQKRLAARLEDGGYGNVEQCIRDKYYTVLEIETYMKKKLAWMRVEQYDGDEESEKRSYEYYREMLKMPLKK
ncbi:MAG: hypothetical protein RSA64_05195 [Christensenellaceae bacterium]